MGHDNREPLGDMETGGHAALPIWMDLMKAAIADRPEESFPGDAASPARTSLALKEGSASPAQHPKADATPPARKPLGRSLPPQTRSASHSQEHASLYDSGKQLRRGP